MGWLASLWSWWRRPVGTRSQFGAVGPLEPRAERLSGLCLWTEVPFPAANRCFLLGQELSSPLDKFLGSYGGRSGSLIPKDTQLQGVK